MNLPSETPRLPKWIFLFGAMVLLVAAWLIYSSSAHTSTIVALVVSACVLSAAWLAVIPFMADYAHRQDEALDNRQRSLQALSVTVASVSEQVSIAATGLQGIAEAAQDNFSKSERLSRQIEEKIAQLDTRLAGARKDDGEVAARLEAAAKKMAELEANLAGATKADGEAAAKLDAVAKRIAKAAAEFDAAVSKAVEAAKAVPAAPPVVPAAVPTIPEIPPVIASRMVEIKPAVLKSDHPFEAPAAPHAAVAAPAAEEKPVAAPVAESVPAPDPVPATEPAPVPSAEPAAAAAVSPEVPKPPRKRSPRKPAPAPAPPPAPAPEAAAPDLVLESPSPAESALFPAPEVSEPAVSADGATRLVVTAYIGIGNRLFIRGEGPGLSWEKGTPLSFVSIGKWRWETNDATAPVRFKLYKNDETECAGLGERTVAPGAQQELTASF
jgi:uncharacterized protein YoxC